ncbi:MAG TPA: GIY-YIG nuclease family protein [Phnomibacter sp.]|nr:GIY-YIG nuclease family protein [Phnomibacter sp.]
MRTYYVYILTNKNKNVLYIGFTNNLIVRLQEHTSEAANPNSKTFAGRYQCYWLVYYETGQSAEQGIAREKEIKGWSRAKKIALIESFNPEWRFLNEDVLG